MSNRTAMLGFVFALSLATALGAVAPANAVAWTRVAKVGDPAPGGQVGETFLSFSTPSVLTDGTIYFIAATQATSALFRRSAAGTITRVFPNAIGAPIAGSDPQVLQLAILFDDHFDYEVAEGDVLRVVSSVELAGCSTATTALLVRQGAGPLELAVQAGEPAPVLGAGWRLRGRLGTSVFNGVPKRNASGDLAFVSNASNDTPCPSAPAPPSTWAAFTTDPLGALVVAAREGQSAPGFTGGIFEPVFRVDQNDAGQLLVTTRVDFAPPAASLAAVYRWSAALGLERLLWQGAPAPGGGLIESAHPAYFAPDGSFFFVEDRPDASGGLYRVDAANTLQALRKVGEDAPGLADGSTFARFSSARFQAPDAFAFTAAVYTGEGTREGIWSVDAPGVLGLRYVGSEPAEIGQPSVTLVTLASDDRLVYARRANELPNGFAYFASLEPGETVPLAAPGDAFAFGAGDVRTAAQIDLETDAAARRSVAVVTDAGGAQALFAPEAGAGAGTVAAAAALAALRVRRGRRR